MNNQSNIERLFAFCPERRTVREYAVIQHGDDQQLFTDGHILISTTGMKPRNGFEGKKADQATLKAPELWEAQTSRDLVLLTKCELRGIFGVGYNRYFETPEGVPVVLNERYVRSFPEDAQFFAGKENPAETAVAVKLDGKLLGVVMPLKTLREDHRELQLVPFLEDAVLYFDHGGCPWME